MNQNIWGPNLWFSLHTMTFTYPLIPSEDDKKNYRTFFYSLQHVIPCAVCKKNYIRHLKEFPVDDHLESRKKLVYWLIDLHNVVNGETGKKILNYDVVLKKYELAYGKPILLDENQKSNDSMEKFQNMFDIHSYSDNFKNIYLFISILIIIIILLIVYFMFLRKKNKIILKKK